MKITIKKIAKKSLSDYKFWNDVYLTIKQKLKRTY